MEYTPDLGSGPLLDARSTRAEGTMKNLRVYANMEKRATSKVADFVGSTPTARTKIYDKMSAWVQNSV